MVNVRFLGILAFCCFATGQLVSCAPQKKFVWGSYESSLYGYYKDPEKLENLMKALETAIDRGEKAAGLNSRNGRPRQIAPGLYAEYGYLLMLKNESDKAIVYFEKEKQSWPESSVLMERMIASVNQGKKRKIIGDK